MGATEDEIVSALGKLEELNLIQKKDGVYRPLKRSFRIPDHFGDLGLEAFYTNNLLEAQNAIALPKEGCRFKSLFLPMNKKEFEAFLEKMQNFSAEVLRPYDADAYAGRRLYQVHINIIPVSQPTPTGHEDADL